jgi:hypothetical protein
VRLNVYDETLACPPCRTFVRFGHGRTPASRPTILTAREITERQPIALLLGRLSRPIGSTANRVADVRR